MSFVRPLQLERSAFAGIVARTVPAPVLVLGALVPAPVLLAAVRGGQDFASALFASAVLAGAGAGYVADDPAAPTLGPSPTTLGVRRLARAVLTVGLLGGVWALSLLVAHGMGDVAVGTGDLAATLWATAGVAAAVATRSPTDAPVGVGFHAAVTAGLVMVTISALAYRWPEVLPSLGPSAHPGRWWWIAAVGTVFAVRWSRDPATR